MEHGAHILQDVLGNRRELHASFDFPRLAQAGTCQPCPGIGPIVSAIFAGPVNIYDFQVVCLCLAIFLLVERYKPKVAQRKRQADQAFRLPKFGERPGPELLRFGGRPCRAASMAPNPSSLLMLMRSSNS